MVPSSWLVETFEMRAEIIIGTTIIIEDSVLP